jgi:DNA processing protein
MPAGVRLLEEQLHWIALALVPGLGPRRAAQLLQQFCSPQALFRASVSEMEACGLPGSLARSIHSGCIFDDAVIQQERLLEHGASIVTLADPDYPPRLRDIYDPPLILFVKGRRELLRTLMLGVVGTRHPTPYGNAASARLAADLASAGFTIVSGMARGIDTAAHRGALQAGGTTAAVFGCGIDLVYPAENRALHAEIAAKGLLVSEFPMGAPAFPQNFPIRNRIISGMSCGILVVEGAQYSGSAITAKLAMEQGREVFAVPGNITSRVSYGPNLLIKEGAKLVQDWNDVFTELSPNERLSLRSAGRDAAEEPAQAKLPIDSPSTPLQKLILQRIQPDKATHIDDLIATLENYSSSEVIAALFELEMLGLVRQLPGRNFVKVW